MKQHTDRRLIRWLCDLSRSDVGSVGGKNASLGEMIRTLKKKDVRVPDGFASAASQTQEDVIQDSPSDSTGAGPGRTAENK